MVLCRKNIFLPTEEESVKFGRVLFQIVNQINYLTVHNFRLSDPEFKNLQIGMAKAFEKPWIPTSQWTWNQVNSDFWKGKCGTVIWQPDSLNLFIFQEQSIGLDITEHVKNLQTAFREYRNRVSNFEWHKRYFQRIGFFLLVCDLFQAFSCFFVYVNQFFNLEKGYYLIGIFIRWGSWCNRTLFEKGRSQRSWRVITTAGLASGFKHVIVGRYSKGGTVAGCFYWGFLYFAALKEIDKIAGWTLVADWWLLNFAVPFFFFLLFKIFDFLEIRK